MAYYSAHYRDDSKPYLYERVEMGERSGIRYLYKTENRKEAFCAAQETANKTGKMVTVMIERPVAGRGLVTECEYVYPVRGKIKFVRMYKMYRENWYDVIYHSGRVTTYTEPELPATVENFVSSATIRRQQRDRTFSRDEMLYY